MHAMYRQIIIRYRVKSDGRMVFLEIDSSLLSRFAFWLPEIPSAHFCMEACRRQEAQHDIMPR